MDTETKPLWTTTREAMGKTWTIHLAADDKVLHKGGSNFGKAHFAMQEINVNAGLPCQTRDQCLLHEITHMIDAELDLDMEEKDVVRLSAVMFAFLCGFGLWNEFPWPDKEEPTK